MDDGKNQKSTPVVIIKDLPVAYPHTHTCTTPYLVTFNILSLGLDYWKNPKEVGIDRQNLKHILRTIVYCAEILGTC